MNLLDGEYDSRASVDEASLELAVLVPDSLACSILPVLILRKLAVRCISEEDVLSDEAVTHLLAFKPECGRPNPPVMLFRRGLL